jgi:hypothetical protein
MTRRDLLRATVGALVAPVVGLLSKRKPPVIAVGWDVETDTFTFLDVDAMANLPQYQEYPVKWIRMDVRCVKNEYTGNLDAVGGLS